MKRKYWVYLASVALIAVFVGLLAKRVYVEEEKRKRDEAGYSTFALTFAQRRKAPDFTLKDLNGNEVDLRDMRGRVVLINFRTTW